MEREPHDFFFAPSLSAAEKRRRAALQDGLAHGGQIAPRDPAPGDAVTLFFTANADLPIDRVAVYYTTTGAEPAGECGVSASSVTVLAEAGALMCDVATRLPMREWRAVIPGQPNGTLVRYRADAWSTSDVEAHWFADNVDPVSAPPTHGRLFAYSVDRFQRPDWFDDAVIYQIFVDRFATGKGEPPMRDPGSITGIHGGTLRGVLEQLDYVQALGITCIWLSPIFESPSAHGYDPSNYYHVAARLGSDETLVELIGEAHRRGIRVLLDFVANHTSMQHPLFREARAHPESPAARWYTFGPQWPSGYASYANVGSMPELATERDEVQRYLIGAALDWLGYFGADGLRLDYVPGPTLAFWAAFQHRIKRHHPQALTLGEITEPLEDLAAYAGRMDAFMDFPLTRLLRLVFAERKASVAELLEYLDARRPHLPGNMGRATLLDNHDMQRLLWMARGDIRRLKLAAVCHLTLEGTPIVYYGTEVGLSQGDDALHENANARAPMLWGERQDRSLLAHYQRLIALRRAHPALRRGQHVRLVTTVRRADDPAGQEQVGAYVRRLDDDVVMVALNNSERAVTVEVSLGEIAELRGRTLRELVASEGASTLVSSNGCVHVELPPLSAAVLAPA